MILYCFNVPYTFAWTNLTTGTYNLTAKATDNLNATTTSSDGFSLTTDLPLESLRVIDQLGRERLIFNPLEAFQTLNFGEKLPIGIYFLEIKALNQPLEIIKMVKFM